jgi:hypothetical protein
LSSEFFEIKTAETMREVGAAVIRVGPSTAKRKNWRHRVNSSRTRPRFVHAHPPRSAPFSLQALEL